MFGDRRKSGPVLEQLDEIEKALGKNVLTPGEQDGAKLLYLASNAPLREDEKTSNQIARILITYAWKKKFAGEDKKTVLEIAAQAAQYAKSGHDLGLYHYAMASLYRGYGDKAASEKSARLALDFFPDSPLIVGHIYNCLALLYREDLPQALQYAQTAYEYNCLPNAHTGDISKAAEVIHASEGDLGARTLMNFAQFYYKGGNYQEALKAAAEVLVQKIQLPLADEDIAYTRIVYGEAANACDAHNAAYTALIASYEFYQHKYAQTPNANHLRCIAALANTYAHLRDHDEAESLIEQGRDIATALKYPANHDFVRALNAVSEYVEEHSRISVTCR